MDTSSALSAFQTASGMSPDTLSLVINTIFTVLIFLWCGWCVLCHFKKYIHHFDGNISSIVMDYWRIIFVLALALAIVAI